MITSVFFFFKYIFDLIAVLLFVLFWQCQMNMNSVERIQEYVDVVPELYEPSTSLISTSSSSSSSSSSSLVTDFDSNDIKWPSCGNIEFKNINLKYATSHTRVLRYYNY